MSQPSWGELDATIHDRPSIHEWRKALEFYASLPNYCKVIENGAKLLHPDADSPIGKDLGKTARIALGIEVETK